MRDLFIWLNLLRGENNVSFVILYSWKYLCDCSNDHPEAVLMSMQTIMVLLIDESEDVPEEPVLALLAALGQQKKVGQVTWLNRLYHCGL